MDWFPWLLYLHVLGAIAAFGTSFVFPIIGMMGGREPQHANFAIRVSHTIANRLTYPVGLTLAVTGLLMILVRGFNLTSGSYYWLDLAIVLYVVALGYAMGVQNRTVGRLIEVTSVPPPQGAGGPPPEVKGLVQRVQRGGMLLTVLLVLIVFLMVVKPGL